MGSRKDLDSLRISQRSNGLAFSHHHFVSPPASPTLPARRILSILKQSDGNAPAGRRARSCLPQSRDQDEGTGQAVVTGYAVKSLIPPSPPKRMNVPNRACRRRNSESSILSSISITSFVSTASRKRKFREQVDITSLPSELLHMIFSGLPQEDLHCLMLANSSFTDTAASLMYEQPLFASTYRFAQFAHIVGHKKHYGDMVRVLDVSPFWESPRNEEPQAGWREWKYRNDVLHRANRERNTRRGFTVSTPAVMRRPGSSHPLPSPFLISWAFHRDLPIGGICHVLRACGRLREINLSRSQLCPDFLVRHPKHQPTTWTGLIFVSDIPKSWTWEPNEIQPVYNIYIIDQMRKLPFLETVIAKKFISMTTLMVKELVDLTPNLVYLDLRKSGMTTQPWSVEGNRETMRDILKKMEESGRMTSSVTRRLVWD